MSLLRYLFLCAMLGVATGCTSMPVSTDYDPNVDFSRYHSFAWLPGPQVLTGDPRLDSPLLDARIRGAVERTLATKGYMHAATDKADLLVQYHTVLEGKYDVETAYAAGPYRGWGYPGAPQTVAVREYEEGTLILDLLDATKQQVVWRGSVQAEVRKGTTPEQREQRINEAVRLIFDAFPPKKK